MNNVEFAQKLEERTKKFAVNIIKLSSSIEYSVESKVLRHQITKSGTSIGANYREANRARSKADFRNKIKICQGEASETIYWLELLNEFSPNLSGKINNLLAEGKELLAIFTSILSKLDSKNS